MHLCLTCPDVIHFFVNFDVFKWLYLAYLINIGSINTKLRDFVKLGVHIWDP